MEQGNRKIIPCRVEDEQIIGAGVVVGAAGSHNDVALALRFNQTWEGTSKRVVWHNAMGENPILTALTTDMIDRTDGETYLVPIPAEAKAVAGDMMVTIRGVEVANGKETKAVVAATAAFKVLPARWDPDASQSQDITPSQADRFQAQLEAIKDDIVNAAKAADAKEAAQAAQQGAEAARDGAKSAQSGAQAAQKAAETARDGAQSAQSAAQSAQSAAQAAQQAAEVARDGVENAQSAAQAAQRAAETARDGAQNAQSNAQAAQRGAETAQNMAEAARWAAETARDDAGRSAASAEGAAEQARASQKAIENMGVSAETLSPGYEATVVKTVDDDGSVELHFGIPKGVQGETGPQGEQGVQGPPGPQGVNGVCVEASGLYGFSVDEKGHLILTYTGEEAPAFSVGENGHLYLNL